MTIVNPCIPKFDWLQAGPSMQHTGPMMPLNAGQTLQPQWLEFLVPVLKDVAKEVIERLQAGPGMQHTGPMMPLNAGQTLQPQWLEFLVPVLKDVAKEVIE
ncbi:hypothetical protein, partial [Bacillus cereus group sp. MYBK14-1]|uniref:hypothetical protein n=1 Tax=Bacillus cereus group sp. MYBK14-1 TaxID=3450682 RepID=UPI003F7A9EB6